MSTAVAKDTPRETLTPEEVEQIRTEANTPGTTLVSVANKWGVDVGHVRFIARRYR